MLGWIKDIGIVVLIFMLFGSIPIGLNYSGFCWEQGRWLSDEERIRLMISEEIRHGFVKGKSSLDATIIQYNDVDEFLEKNPDCCKLGYKYTSEHSNDGTYWPFSFLDSILIGGDVVSLYYSENFIDGNGAYDSRNALSFYAVSNCGKNLN